MKRIAISGVVIYSVCATAEPSTNYLAQALARTSDAPTYRYDLYYETHAISALASIDPSQPTDGRVVMHQPPENEWTEDIREGIEEMRSEPMADFYCANAADMVPTDAALVDEDETTAQYRFVPMGDPDDATDQKMMEKLVGQVKVTKNNPAILSLSLRAPEPFKPVWFAKVNRFELNITCQLLPDGNSHVSRVEMQVEGKAAMKKIHEWEIREIRNVQTIE